MLTANVELKPFTDETIERLRAVTDDPIDAMRLAADVYAINAYQAERIAATQAGQAPPKLPEPISAYLRSFTVDLKSKLAEMSRLFSSDELARLVALGSAVVKQLECDDGDLIGHLLVLLAMHPADAVLWVRAHLEDIEARFAS